MQLPFVKWPLRIAYKIGRRLATLDINHLLLLEADQMQPAKPLGDGYQLFVMTPDQVREFATDPRHDLDPLMAYRLLFKRDVCIGVQHHGKLAGYAWFAFRSIEAELNRGAKRSTGVAIRFAANTAFLYKAFVLPEHRGQGLYPAIVEFAMHTLAADGVDQILATTEWINTPGLTSCAKMGFRRIGRTYRAGIGKLVIGKYPWGARKYGIRCGNGWRPRWATPNDSSAMAYRLFTNRG